MPGYNRDLLRRWTLLCLMRGVEDSDRMRELFARHYHLSDQDVREPAGGSPTSAFVNEHAWVLSELNRGRRPAIEKLGEKRYRLAARGREMFRRDGLERHLPVLDRLLREAKTPGEPR